VTDDQNRTTVDEREERIGRNEALFRVVNERLEDLNQAFSVVDDDGFEIVCECGDGACIEQIMIPAAEYSRIRSDPTLFILVHGHEDVTVEAVVEDERDAYLVVRKRPGGPADLAAEGAPER
jgi:muramoyltetrapeptide carboxypeptidase LdcA involved in peptidoglycan recycling